MAITLAFLFFITSSHLHFLAFSWPSYPEQLPPSPFLCPPSHTSSTSLPLSPSSRLPLSLALLPSSPHCLCSANKLNIALQFPFIHGSLIFSVWICVPRCTLAEQPWKLEANTRRSLLLNCRICPSYYLFRLSRCHNCGIDESLEFVFSGCSSDHFHRLEQGKNIVAKSRPWHLDF